MIIVGVFFGLLLGFMISEKENCPIWLFILWAGTVMLLMEGR